MDQIENMKSQIARILDMKPELLIYEQSKSRNGREQLDLVTISPNAHQTKFLFHRSEADTAEAAFKQMFDYVSTHMKEQDTFQIRWHNPKTKQIEVSWFRASNILEALDKFYHHGKEVGEYKIYEVSLRPYA